MTNKRRNSHLAQIERDLKLITFNKRDKHQRSIAEVQQWLRRFKREIEIQPSLS